MYTKSLPLVAVPKHCCDVFAPEPQVAVDANTLNLCAGVWGCESLDLRHVPAIYYNIFGFSLNNFKVKEKQNK